MFSKSLLILSILISSSSASLIERLSNDIEENVPNGDIWVVLVAGSNGYYNYRHQADVLHAYQLVQKIHQIPKERIILFM